MSESGGESDTEFAERLVTLFQSIHPLDRVPRAGYLLRGVAEPESVAAHAHFLALMALVFCERHPEYDKARVLSMALVHDLPEALLMDIPMPHADAYLDAAKHRAEQAIADDLLGGLPGRLAELHREFTEAATPEARLVRALDKAQMMVKVLCYERERRGCLEEFWSNPKNFNDFGIAAVSALFDTVCRQASRVRPG